MEEYKNKISLAIIGGSGLYSALPSTKKIQVMTPYGQPSDLIHIFQIESTWFAFLSRHGDGHSFGPSEVNYRANIAALKWLGCKAIIAFSAVGSLRQEIEPRHFVLPSQVIDRTKGIRPSTFFENGVVSHSPFADPFSHELNDWIYKLSKDIQGLTVHRDKTLVCIEGPQFSTRAESHLYRKWDCDIINMSCLPESKLASEAELPYIMICMSTDYDCWKTGDHVTVEAVMKVMSANGEMARLLIKHICNTVASEGLAVVEDAWRSKQNSMKNSCCTRQDKRNPETLKKLEFILPGFFS